MTWDPRTSCGHESAKVASIAVPYLQGRLLDLGCGNAKVWPSAIGVDSGAVYGKAEADIACDIAGLSLFSDASFDAVFSSHALEDFPREQVPAVLAEWTRVLKIGGYLVLYVPSANLYPKVGEEGANPAHKWDIYPGDVEAILKELVDKPREEGLVGPYKFGFGFELLESEERGDTNEYSLFVVVRKTLAGWKENVRQRNPGGKKRALVVRFGAIGDQIQAASILPELRKQGYHVTYCTTPKGQTVVKYDPFVDEWLIQETDFVPNVQLGPYFQSIQERYDLFVNLCESIEGSLLSIPGRVNHGYPDAVRRSMCGTVNYLDRIHDLASVPREFHPKYYATAAELSDARAWRARVCGDEPVIYWAINGSSNHKVWPYTHIAIKWLAERTPCHIVMTADPGVGFSLQEGITEALVESGCDMTRVHGVAGQWSIRQSLTFALIADCVVGPETGMLNAVGFEVVPKVVMLSHSSPTNLTRDWVNATTLTPPTDKAPCYPCHRLHYDWTFCPKDPGAEAALCAASISPERVFEAIALAMGAVKLQEAAD